MSPDRARRDATAIDEPSSVSSVPTAGEDGDPGRTSGRVRDEPDVLVRHLVDWEATARRLRRSSLVLLGSGLLAWVVTSLVRGAWSPASLGNWLGLALLAMFVAEVVVVGGSAVRGLLRAGDAGERLSSGDVGLLPPARRRER